MTDGAALLAAILADPDDDAPRLVYADWLDEHGEPERAEFIRVQCELARTPGSDILSEPCKTCGSLAGVFHYDNCRYQALRRRERELWNAATQFGIDTTAIWPIEVRRGFIDSLTCTAADWLAHADAITAAHPVREVRLTTLGQLREWILVCARRVNHDETFRPLLLKFSSFINMPPDRDTVANALSELWPDITFELQ